MEGRALLGSLLVVGALLGSVVLALASNSPDGAADAGPAFGAPVRVADLLIFEPSVRVDSTGVIFAGGARGLPSASPVYRSEDGGASWTRLALPPGHAALGAEPELALAADDTLYVSELTVANTIIYRYTNHGKTLAGWMEISQGTTGVDRQWITVGKPSAANAVTGGHEMWINTYDVGRGILSYYTPDAAAVPALKPVKLGSLTAIGGPSSPPVYDAVTGNVYAPVSENGQFYMTVTKATQVGVFAGKHIIAPVSDAVNQFAVAAVDDAGNVYVTWSQATTGGNWDVFLAVSTNQAVTWGAPIQLSSGGSHVYPWMDAGAAGQVAVAWYGTPNAGHPESNNGPWRVHVALASDVLAAPPTVTVLPDVVQEGHGICLSGSGCTLSPSGSRALGDYFQVAIGPDGKAHIAYAKAVNGQNARMYHVKQTA